MIEGNPLSTPEATNEQSQPLSSSNALPSSGWVRHTDLYRATQRGQQLNKADRHKVVRELSQELNSDVGIHQPMSILQEVFAMFLFLMFPGCMVWVPFGLAGSAWAAYRYLPAGGPLQVILGLVAAALFFWPLRHWPASMRTWITPHLFRYTSSCSAWEAPLEATGGPYLLVAPPHGVLPVSNVITMLAFPMLWGFCFKGLTTDAALRLPLMRHVMTWIGCQSAEKEKVACSVSEGWSVGLCPGGVAEIFDTNNNDEVLFLKGRKGFVKLSLRMGTTLVPCYMFGNTRLFRSWHDPYGILRALSRKLGFGLLLVWGRLLLPVIRRQPLLAVIGRPIKTPKSAGEPTQADIDKYHALYVSELRRIFDKYKGAYGWGDKELIIK